MEWTKRIKDPTVKTSHLDQLDPQPLRSGHFCPLKQFDKRGVLLDISDRRRRAPFSRPFSPILVYNTGLRFQSSINPKARRVIKTVAISDCRFRISDLKGEEMDRRQMTGCTKDYALWIIRLVESLPDT